MLTNGLQILMFTVFSYFVPGLPGALYIGRRTSSPHIVFALSPILSIGANFFLLQILNYTKIRVDLRVIAVVELVLTAILIYRPYHKKTNTNQSVLTYLKALLSVVPAAVIGVLIWKRAYSGFMFLAANHDGFNHNRFIARILYSGSALAKDALIVSPFQRLGVGGGFYPLAWHADVAVWTSISGLKVPVASLASVILIWCVALPFGLRALADIWAPKIHHLGMIAAILSQIYPLVPGVPMTWGSMTSVVGIAFLPASLVAGVLILRDRDKVHVGLCALVLLTLFFIHTPEAMTLLVLMLAVVMTSLNRLNRSMVYALTLALLSFVVPLLYVFRDTIFFNSSSLKTLWGAAHPSWEIAIGSIFSMSINTHVGFSILSLLFVFGLVQSSIDVNERWLTLGILSIIFVYLVSGSATGPLSHLRILTSPWYASYERTAWVLVPFASLLSAYPLAKLLPSNLKARLPIRIFAILAVALLLQQILTEQINPTIEQVRSGPAKSAMIGNGDVQVIQKLRDVLGKDKIALTFEADGSTYAYMYENLRVTSGVNVNKRGVLSDQLSTVYANVGDLCVSKEARNAFDAEQIGAVVFGKRGTWGQALWTEPIVRKLTGLRIVSEGEFLILAVPEFEKC